jgi:hypothetical protein
MVASHTVQATRIGCLFDQYTVKNDLGFCIALTYRPVNSRRYRSQPRVRHSEISKTVHSLIGVTFQEQALC